MSCYDRIIVLLSGDIRVAILKIYRLWKGGGGEGEG